MKIVRILSVVMIFFTATILQANGADKVVEQPLTFGGPQYEIEDLTAQLQSEGSVILVSGKIRNLGHSATRGYVIVYLRDGNNDVIHAMETDVNEKRPFGHGMAGYFEVSANIEGLSGLANVSIEFVTN
ncbi:MAG: hypothetical protein JEZ11_09470 [Desulfobacterales bacterium]|nr:hypothetical protein [Desulfobacterales bacterium]